MQQQRAVRRRSPTAARRRPRRAGAAALTNTSPWPGSTTPQPNAPSTKRAKAIAFATGSSPPMRRTVPSRRSSLVDRSSRPTTRARGRRSSAAGARRSRRASPAGMASRVTKSTGSPDFAAQPAAGIAKLGLLGGGHDDDARRLARPRAVASSASIARRARRSRRRRRRRLAALGLGRRRRRGSPARRRPRARPSARARRAPASVAGGSVVAVGRAAGAPIGSAMSCGGGDAARQSVASTSATASGACRLVARGKTARATAAAFAIGSAPPTRVVFFVAKAGKPRSVAAASSSPPWP